ncbi:MAG: four helix bundle protein [Anaerolineae bacterium]|nr:four helix bundle protein [Anaerolineae bacterium]
MAKVQSFEELIAWQKARDLARRIYGITTQGRFARDFGLSRQMQRSAVSIMSNIAEGYDRGSLGDYFRFLSIAKGSCAELRSQIYVAYDIGYLTAAEFQQLRDDTIELSRIIGGLRASVQRRRNDSNT